jgi:uncharacterized Ntn-hydrolase superfamily protein
MLGMHALPGVGLVHTAGWADFSHAPRALGMLESGLTAPEVVENLIQADSGQARRQLMVIDARGNLAVHSGDGLNDWKGHHLGPDFLVAGNYLTGAEPLSEMAHAFQEAHGPLAERLLQALDAGQRLGADRRGKVSASLMITKRRQYPPVTVRVDYSSSGDAVSELWRTYRAFMEKMYPLFPRFDWPDRW